MKKKLLLFGVSVIVLVVLFFLYVKDVDFSLEKTIIQLWDKYVATWGYLILFLWSVLEGELGLIFAGIAAHMGHLNVWLAIFIAGLGGFAGDQIYFYIGRYNKAYIQKKLVSQRRKLALAHLLLQKYGWMIIFIQRYMYGMRTIIPISIGLTRYSALKFALINLISAWIWSAITILLAWVLGDQILEILKLFKQNPFIIVIFAVIFFGGVIWYFNRHTKRLKSQEVEVMSQNIQERLEKEEGI
ncbi:putative integral membrane protein (dedA family) [Helicobacter mustelae 12198]|uniref:Putative integral membrane protein (DedA family) n=1 Tax=Helicobacter mustelae (strain ATCC 43772 / CCUG 25715 / CIP 103759 / LMG 18044 / NCTC 12198 / R85-136P) TaxID=679897 RepID=D3UHD7_HELM1|nr:putative integral membrane protein (dedA family) [Helicobacter mustelae 12198]SQH71420.1 DedA family integral membrane protein [Helicobacter mustelae]